MMATERAGDTRKDAAAREEAREEFLVTGRPYLEEQAPVREALRLLAERLRAVGETYGGELEAEARLVWLDSLLPLRDMADLARALSHVEAVCLFVDNWTDSVENATPRGARAAEYLAERYRSAEFTVKEMLAHGKLTIPARAATEAAEILCPALLAVAAEHAAVAESGEEDAFEAVVIPARVAAGAALTAFCTLVDAVRDRAPEALK